MSIFEGPGPRVYSIASGRAFVDDLAATLLQEAGGDPAALAAMRVLLPTRRACRALADAFLRQSDGQAALLPRLMPLGDIDEDELGIHTGAVAEPGAGADVPPAMPSLARQLILARLIMALPGRQAQPEQAVGLAAELARLIDRLATEECEPARLKTLVPDDYSAHWQEVLAFLDILIERWPDILAGEGALDSTDRRGRLLRAEAARWQSAPPASPVIAAGSTGSIPATAALLKVVASLPKGAVILPGLDRDCGDDAWDALGPTHPQFGLKLLSQRLGIERSGVRPFPGNDMTAPRARLLADALRPAELELAPPPDADLIEGARRGLRRIDCKGPAEEAQVVALLMRQSLETPGATAALVTPDRGLARRVAAELRRWRIDVDDSAGTPLAATPAGAFLRLVADAIAERLAPVPLLALLKHPLAAGGMAAADFREMARTLEEAALRGPRPAPGIAGLREAIADDRRKARLLPLLDRVEERLKPLADLCRAGATPLRPVVEAHVAAAEALAATDAADGRTRLWSGDDGEAAAAFVGELAEALDRLGPLEGDRYPALFEQLIAGRVVRPRFGRHPRLFIWGLMEARLQRVDTVILGGLNEAAWPPEAESNPWMSRPMMAALGLEMPERRIGLTAHDFQQAFAAPNVVLTRAERVGGAETVPSRWLMRLDNLLARAEAGPLADTGENKQWLHWTATLDSPARYWPEEEEGKRRAPAPAPRPPAEARPNKLSVTRIETLIRDPYAIYARYVLGLKVLDPIDADPGAADRGNVIHEALGEFVKAHPGPLPDDAERRLIEIGREAFGGHLARPGVRAFWWPRFLTIAHWFVGWQRERLRDGWRSVLVEEEGAMTIDAIRGGFTLTAKPDRIDLNDAVGLSILDYKTGAPPSGKQVLSGLSPQLPLEALMALAGAFPGVPAERVVEMMYVRVSGGREPGIAKPLKFDVAEVIETTREGVQRLLVRFADAKTPYLSRPRPQFDARFGDYDHLARVQEWGAGGDDE